MRFRNPRASFPVGADVPTGISLAVDAYAPMERHPPHQHGLLHLSLVIRGSLAETVGHRTEHAGALSVVAKEPGVVHEDRFGPDGATLARLCPERGGLDALLDDQARITPWCWKHDARAAVPFLRLVHRFQAGSRSFAPGDPDILDLLAAVTARSVPSSPGDPPAWLRRTMEDLRTSWRARMVVPDVAQRAGVHPVYLARCVRRWYGHGVRDELRRLRVAAAAHRLASGGGTVSHVAHATGFADEPHLCREFRRTTGMTAGHYRRLTREVANIQVS